jgi:hypothetical protein
MRLSLEDARRMDKARKGKKVSNEDWASPTDADARIVRLKDGRTRLGYKAEHVVDLETGAVVAAEVYSGEQADTATLRPSLEAARDNVTHLQVRRHIPGERRGRHRHRVGPARPRSSLGSSNGVLSRDEKRPSVPSRSPLVTTTRWMGVRRPERGSISGSSCIWR